MCNISRDITSYLSTVASEDPVKPQLPPYHLLFMTSTSTLLPSLYHISFLLLSSTTASTLCSPTYIPLSTTTSSSIPSIHNPYLIHGWKIRAYALSERPQIPLFLLIPSFHMLPLTLTHHHYYSHFWHPSLHTPTTISHSVSLSLSISISLCSSHSALPLQHLFIPSTPTQMVAEL